MKGFAGLSHLGIVSSIATAAKGFDVVAYGEDEALCESLNNGQPPFFEPELAELLKANQSRINFTTDAARLKDCGVIYFALDIPTEDDGTSNLAPLESLLEKVIALAAPETRLVVLSQVPPGFTRRHQRKISENYESRKLQLFYQVETLIFGRAVERALYPERFILGCLNPQEELPRAYAELLESFDCPILPMRYESAELTKISINMCLVSSISVANTLAELCEKIGADWSEMVPALKLDKRIGAHAYLSPGLGIAGGNLERDLATVVALSNEHGADDGVVDAWVANSRYRRDWALRVIHAEAISKIENPRIAVWGLAYKQDTTSTKNSPALALVDALTPFQIRAYDPQVILKDERPKTFSQVGSALEAVDGASLLVIMTPWREFSSITAAEITKRMRGRLIVDPFGMLDERACLEAGFSYFRLGSTASRSE